MNEQEVRIKIEAAIQKLIDHDRPLLEIDVNERTITHRLAIYIEELFPEWKVDCEYNRLFDQSKQIVVTKKILSMEGNGTTSVTDEHAKTVYPDIIIHHRISTDNLVIIEVKKTTNRTPDNADIGKLQAYKEQIGYVYAVFLRLRTGVKDVGKERLEIF